MKDYTFRVPQEIIFGAGSLGRLPELLKKSRLERILIISGRNLQRLGTVKKVADIVEAAGIGASIFTDVEANPSVETVEKAAAAYRDSGAAGIVALGGGSPMDVAKAVGVVVSCSGEITQYEGADRVPGSIVPLIAIPTTAGSGSETTAFSVITDRARNYKLSVFSYELVPRQALLDPELICSLPASVAASTGLDALIHALESYISLGASPFSDAMAEKAMELIGGSIRAFVSDRRNVEAAGAMMSGSTFAGIAFSWARLGNVHAMSHPISACFNVPHGVANAILLPTILEYNAVADRGRYRKIYDAICPVKSGGDFTASMLVDEVRRLQRELGIPARLTDVGVTADMIPRMAADAMKSGNIAVNPRQTALADVKQLYYTAL